MALKILGREQKKTIQAARECDKRYFPRWEANRRVEYSEAGGATFRSYTKDLSLDGASIFVFGRPSVRHHLQLKIYLADKENIEVRGRIAWVKPEPTYQLLGIAFENLRKKAQESIIRHAFELREDHVLLLPGDPFIRSIKRWAALADVSVPLNKIKMGVLGSKDLRRQGQAAALV